MNVKKPVMLMILDGYGHNENEYGNAVMAANTPVMDKLKSEYPNIIANASGLPVGLPEGQMGNSEVGHTNIGAGRVVYQSLTLINKEISEGVFKKNSVIVNAIENMKHNSGKLHLLGLVSPGGVHSMDKHLYALVDAAKEHGVDDKTIIHIITDGRDVAPKTAKEFVTALIKEIEGTKVQIGSINGRYFAMDRDQRWEREQLAYDAIVNRTGESFTDVLEYIQESYDNGTTDEFIKPAFNSNVEDSEINSGDSVIFYNFRPDRARELSHMLVGSSSYDYKPEGKELKNIHLATMRPYLGIESNVIYPVITLKNTLGEVLNNEGLNQIRTAETEKYPHVTFFLDGGMVEFDFDTEKKLLINSPKVATYDMQPEMSAYGVTETLLENIEFADATIINFANPDMVGHTGDMPAVIKAVEVVDECMGKIYDKFVTEMGGVMIIVADHGNADEMMYEDGSPLTKHTTNPVPVVITSKDVEFKPEFTDFKNPTAKLGDFAPTLLKILNIDIPEEMTGNVLIK